MRIGVISDTHGYLDPKVFKYFDECDEIWHAGDIGHIDVADNLSKVKPLKAVYGNIDGGIVRKSFPLDQKFEIERLKIWITHIGNFQGRYDRRLIPYFEKQAPDIFVCGHSHILKVNKEKRFNNMLHINPGASGKHGFHKVRTILRFSIIDGNIKDMEAIELGKR
ncbi:metallophosphoesterase family protein [bacterium AH-315-C07]|nr:metallophosphoesterase family protein [bacterium AH-315-C07]